jgi:DNA-binding NarL/FixJ family response regulator
MSHRKRIKRTILLVEDHPMTLMGLKMMIQGEADLSVCGEATNAGEALDASIQLKPDLVITDITLPGRSGFELIQDLRSACPNLPVLVLSMHSEKTYARRALEIGARGYIMKCENSGAILEAIRTVLSGSISVSGAVSGHLLEFLATNSKKRKSGIDALTAREFEVFKLIGDGVSTCKIANDLNMSPKTVESHRSNIKSKLQTRTMAELTALAADWFARQSMAESPKSAMVA